MVRRQSSFWGKPSNPTRAFVRIMAHFRMPYGVSDTTLVAKANAIAEAAQPIKVILSRMGHEKTFADDLRAHITTFEQANTTQNSGQQSHAGATAGFEPLIADAMAKVKQLDAFVHNFYKSNAEKLGEWKAPATSSANQKRRTAGTPTASKFKTASATKTTLAGSPTEGLAGA